MSRQEEFKHVSTISKEAGGVADRAFIFQRVNGQPDPEVTPAIIPELMGVAISFRLFNPDRGRIHRKDSECAQVLFLRGDESQYLIEIMGEGIEGLSDEQVEAEANGFFQAYGKQAEASALRDNEAWRDRIADEVNLDYGFSAQLMDLPEYELIDSHPSWLAASKDHMAKAWPKLSSAQTDADRELAFYIDRARIFGTDAPPHIKEQIKGELRLAKNAHSKRKGVKHRLALEILTRWHRLAKMTIPEIHQILLSEGVKCEKEQVEKAIERLKIKRPVNRHRPDQKA